MDELGPALEEYKSLRQETLDALGRQQAIAQYGLATAGLGLGLGLVAGKEHQTAVAAIVLMALMPLLALFGAVMMATEAQRAARAGWYLRGLEARINDNLSERAVGLGWETLLATGTTYQVRGYGELIGIVSATTGAISIGIGGYLLANEELWGWLAGALLVDGWTFAVFAFWTRRIWARLQWFRRAPPDAHPIW